MICHLSFEFFMYYYNIIPLLKTSLDKSPCFTYESEQKIPFGSLVEIDFARKKIKGVVYNQAPKPKFFTKPIGKILSLSLLTPKQLDFAQKISTHYFTSLGVVLKFFIPPIAKKLTDLKKYNSSPAKNVVLTPAQQKAVTSILSSQSRKKFLLFGPASSGKTEVIMQLVREMLAQKKQSLILIPEIFLSYQEIERYQQAFGQNECVFVHSGLAGSQLFSAWEKIKSNKAKVIISTRTGIFFPYPNLGLIVLDEEQDSSHKQWDQSPRYHLRELAPWLAQYSRAKVVYASATPSLEIMHRKSIKLISLPGLKTKNIQVMKPTFEIVDLKKYYFKNKNRPIILSDEIKNAISQCLLNKKTVLVLVSRQGKSRLVICHDCHQLLKCPQCQAPLISSGENYICLHCSHKTSGFAQCPKCKSYRLKNIGFGTEKAAEVLKNFFPSAKIWVADAKAFRQETYRADLFQKLRHQEIDILVGSQTIIKGFDVPQVNLVAVLNADDWSGQTDFRFDERWLGNLFQLSGRVNRPGSDQKGLAIIQTFRPENPVYRYLQDWDWASFVKAESQTRKEVAYPPHIQLVRLIHKGPVLKKVEKTANLVYDKLNEIAQSEKKKVAVMPPYDSFVKKQGKNWQKNILVKVSNLDNSLLKPYFSQLSRDWIIDLDPETIF